MTPISSALDQPSAPPAPNYQNGDSDFSSNEEDYSYYNGLELEAIKLVEQRTNEIKVLMRRTSSEIIDLGQKLIEVKDQLGHGNFRKWLKSKFDWSPKTVNRFMQVGENFKCVNLSHLNIAPTALYLLAAPSTSPEVRQEALKRAIEGEAITLDIGQKLIEVKQELGHGNFRNWLKSEFDWSVSATRKIVQVGQQFMDIAPSALYFLASPSTREEAKHKLFYFPGSPGSLEGGIFPCPLASFTATSIKKAARLAVALPSRSAHFSRSAKTVSGRVTKTRLLTCITELLAPYILPFTWLQVASC